MENTQNPITHDPNAALASISRDYEERDTIGRAHELGLSYVDLRKVSINVDLFYLVSEAEAAQGKLMPFFRVGKKVRIALANPDDPETRKMLDVLRQRGYQLNLNLSSASGLAEAQQLYATELLKHDEVIVNAVDEEHLDAFEAEIRNLKEEREKIVNGTPKAALNYLLVGAMKTASSDIHLEPYEKDIAVRFRIDGVLQDILTLDHETGNKLAQQLKHQAHLKLNIADLPQDGRFSFILNERAVDVRVSSLPSIYGESYVLRLLDTGRKAKTLDELGLEGRALTIVDAALTGSDGLILSTGPTGSGKTTTQYAILRGLSTPEKKIITLEDPVEYRVPGITQSQIDHERDYDFAQGLRAILRHDPDVVMVGEIRDLETANIASQAALTGHVVLSTLHTNDAVATVPRLANMGLPPYVVASSLDTVIAQRLVRVICTACCIEAPLSVENHAFAAATLASLREVEPSAPELPAMFALGQGCDACSGTGFRGQIGIFEIFRVTPGIQSAILGGDFTTLLPLARKDGMLTLREDGLKKVLAGVTTMGEVLRVTLG